VLQQLEHNLTKEAKAALERYHILAEEAGDTAEHKACETRPQALRM
jgi:hypothetical protein